MKRFALAVGILGLAAPLAMAQATTWTVDSAHSEVDFAIKHMSIANVRGSFAGVKGAVVYDSKNIAKSSVNVTIDAASVNTSNSARDNVLKSDGFFDVAKDPTAAFASTSVKKVGAKLVVTGNLTLHGITKPVVLDVTASAPVESPMDHKQHIGFSATTTIKRTDFAIGSSFGEAMLSVDVPLTIDLEAVQQ